MDLLLVRQQAGRVRVDSLPQKKQRTQLVRALDDEGLFRLYLGEGGKEMTPEEVAQACQKFNDYLTANGVNVQGHILHFDDSVCGMGQPDALLGALLCMVAGARGYKVVPK
jgi:hypothetical protein